MQLRRFYFLLMILLSSRAMAAIPALVDAVWLKSALESHNPALVILDTQPADAFKRAHIRGAVNTPYAQWRIRNANGIPGMLPPATQLSQLIGGLGITKNSQIVVVPAFGGAGQLASAARIFWTLKTAGIDEVAILNGGMNLFRNDRSLPLANGTQIPKKSSFQAQLRTDWLALESDVQTAIKQQTALVDARSPGEYLGIYRGGPKDRPGTIPGAVNLPFDWLTRDGSTWFRSPKASRELFRQRGAADQGKVIFFCHTGHRAALAWFVDYALLGNSQARLYDGSMAEWSQPGKTPVERKLSLTDE
ncbi:MAG TPA: sulfurtransferase [Gammaproteobacteria bacterium]|nr:sulfurtransferase [Gammaproteobacteria bacterium]